MNQTTLTTRKIRMLTVLGALLAMGPALADGPPRMVAMEQRATGETLEQLLDELEEIDHLNEANADRRARLRMERRLDNARLLVRRLRRELSEAPDARVPVPSRGVEPAPAPPPPSGPLQPQPNPAPLNAPISQPMFDRLQAEVKKASFADDKLNIIREAARTSLFSCRQVVILMGLVPSSSDKVEVAAALNPRVTDPQNYFEVYNAIPFAGDREELKKRLGR